MERLEKKTNMTSRTNKLFEDFQKGLEFYKSVGKEKLADRVEAIGFREELNFPSS